MPFYIVNLVAFGANKVNIKVLRKLFWRWTRFVKSFRFFNDDSNFEGSCIWFLNQILKFRLFHDALLVDQSIMFKYCNSTFFFSYYDKRHIHWQT